MPFACLLTQAARLAIATGENYCIRCLKWTGDPDKLEFHRGNRLLEWQAHSAQRLDRTSRRDPAVAGEACSCVGCAAGADADAD